MELFDYVNLIDMNNLSETEKAKFLCYYLYKETGETIFSSAIITDLFKKSGNNIPNTSRMKNRLLKEKVFMESKGNKGMIEFVPIVLQRLERECSNIWNDEITIVSESEFIDELKFCGKRNYLDKLIKQINCTYKNNCFDACAVILRRLFEVVLILSYQNLGIDNQITNADGNGYYMLDKIVSNAVNNPVLKLSRIKREFDNIRKVGNYSAHSITYIATKKDVDDIKLSYRVMLEELFNKAGLMEVL